MLSSLILSAALLGGGGYEPSVQVTTSVVVRPMAIRQRVVLRSVVRPLRAIRAARPVRGLLFRGGCLGGSCRG